MSTLTSISTTPPLPRDVVKYIVSCIDKWSVVERTFMTDILEYVTTKDWRDLAGAINASPRAVIAYTGYDISFVGVIVKYVDSIASSVLSALALRLVSRSFARAYSARYVYKYIGGSWGRPQHAFVIRINSRMWFKEYYTIAARVETIRTIYRLSDAMNNRRLTRPDGFMSAHTYYGFIRKLLVCDPTLVFDDGRMCLLIERHRVIEQRDMCRITHIYSIIRYN